MTAPATGRLAPIDWMRGLVMILMTSDHAALKEAIESTEPT